MLTFEKVMEVFKDYLTEDTRYEIVMTSHGYTVLEWDSSANIWAGEELRATPEIMQDEMAGYSVSKRGYYFPGEENRPVRFIQGGQSCHRHKTSL